MAKRVHIQRIYSQQGITIDTTVSDKPLCHHDQHEGLTPGIWNDLSVRPPSSLKETKARYFASEHAPSVAFAMSAAKTFVNVDGHDKRGTNSQMRDNDLPQAIVEDTDSIAINAH